METKATLHQIFPMQEITESIPDNAVVMRLLNYEDTCVLFRKMYARLDIITEAIYHPARYTVWEFEKFASEYRILQFKANLLERYLYKYFLTDELDKKIAWMKSNPVGLSPWEDENKANYEPYDIDQIDLFADIEEFEENTMYTMNQWDLPS